MLKEGITQSIAGLYTISPQQRGIYRVVLNPTIMTASDVDYVLIAQDTTGQALDDKVEFTLYDETIDSVYSKLKTEIDVNENLLNVINAGTDEVESLLKNSTYGLSAAKTLQDTNHATIYNKVTTVQNEVISQANSIENLINSSISTNFSDILTEINANENKLDIVISYTDELESLLKHTTYGLSKLKDTLDVVQSAQTTNTSFIINEVISQANENEAKIDTLTNNVALIIPEINNNENKLDIIASYVNEVEPLLTNATYGLSVLKSTLVELQTQSSLNTSSITAEVISQANQNEVKLDTLTSNLSTVEGNITTQISSIPTNPLLTNDSRVSKLNYLDTTSSQLPTLAAQQTWAYPARYLTGTSGVNQIDVAGFNTSFLINQDAFVNVTLRDSSTNAFITGRTYPNDIGVEFWKGGVLIDTSANISIQETATGVYRTTIKAPLINVPAIDYLLVVSDLLGNATSQIVEFTAFEVIGVEGPKVVTIKTIDSSTLLPIPDTQVYVRNLDNNMTINKGLSDNAGNYTTGLTDGTYSVILRKAFTDFTVPETLVVTADTTAVFYGLTFSPSLPVQPNTAVLYGTVIDISGNKLKNAKVMVSETQSDRFSGTSKITKLTKSTTTDTNGAWEIELAWSSTLEPVGIPYKVDITYTGFNFSANVLIPNVSSVEFSTLL